MTSKIVLITGASSGLGLEIARWMHREGHIVYAAARSLEDSFSGQDNSQYNTLKLDVTDEEAAKLAVDKVIAREESLDILVLAAGYGLAGAIEDTSLAEAKAQLETNFFGSVTILAPAIARMRQQGQGLIVFLGSVAGVLPIPFQAYYCAGKAALSALSLTLADELKPFGVNCMLVQPGDTKTGFTNSRIMTGASGPESVYEPRCQRSVKRMSEDENAGMSAEKSAQLILRQMLRRRPPLVYTPGIKYKLFVTLQGFLPLRLVRLIIARLYAS